MKKLLVGLMMLFLMLAPNFSHAQMRNVSLLGNTTVVPMYEPNTILNGTFNTAVTSWTAATGWAWHAGGYCEHTATNVGTLSQATATFAIGSYYRITYDIGGWTAGTVTVSGGGVTEAARGAVGTFTSYIKATATTALSFLPSTDFDGYIDNVVMQKMAEGVIDVPFITNSISGLPLCFDKSLTRSTGNQEAYLFNYTASKAAGNDSGVVVNQTDTTSGGTSYLLDLQSNRASKHSITNTGIMAGTFGATTGGMTLMAYEGYIDITATHTKTIALAIPIGSIIVGTQLRVDTGLTSTETWNAAYNDGSSVQIFAHEQPVAKNTKLYVPFNCLETAGTLSLYSTAGTVLVPVCDASTNITIQKHSNPGTDNFTALGRIRAITYVWVFNTMADN